MLKLGRFQIEFESCSTLAWQIASNRAVNIGGDIKKMIVPTAMPSRTGIYTFSKNSSILFVYAQFQSDQKKQSLISIFELTDILNRCSNINEITCKRCKQIMEKKQTNLT